VATLNLVRTVIKGVGGYLPARVMTNADLAKLVDTSDAWITERTGIKERRIAAEGELTSTMGAVAARAALDDAGLAPEDIDLIILATSTPDQTFPATAVTIQAELGITHGAAFDVQAVCSGFIFALTTADNYLKSGMFKRALVIGAEAFSRILDWEDRSTCVLFGDGAGAVVVEAQKLNGVMTDRGILATCLRSDGRYRDKLYVDGGPSSTGTVGHLRMDGPEVFRHAVTKISEVIGATLDQAGYKASDIDWFVPHQANKRILDGAAKKLGLDKERIIITLDKHANTSAASIPLALNAARADGRIKTDDLVLLEAMGGGFTWGAVLLRW
jgi:3-oxoacyl-[acyl-carrier-protein] synthase-3